MKGVIAWYAYRDRKVKAIIEEIKFGFNKVLVKEVFRKDLELPKEFDFIVPVPLHRLRLNWRGFNQAEEIGKELSKRVNRPLVMALVRRRNTKQQAKIKDKKERRENIHGAFLMNEELSAMTENKAILLVDDVFTSGESMRECAKVLMKNGVREVRGFTLAR